MTDLKFNRGPRDTEYCFRTKANVTAARTIQETINYDVERQDRDGAVEDVRAKLEHLVSIVGLMASLLPKEQQIELAEKLGYEVLP